MKKTQNEKVLELLQAGFKLSAINAMPLIGTMSLNWHVFHLRQKGYKIKTNIIQNGMLKYSEYELEKG